MSEAAEGERTGGNTGAGDGSQGGLTEQMKADDMMNWVRLMNNIRNSAQEIVKATGHLRLEYYDRKP